MVSVSVFEFGRTDTFMVLVSGWSFPEGKSFRVVSTVDEAVDLRRKIQAGMVPLSKVLVPLFLFDDERF